jgi:hypothetical protein
MNQSRFLSSLDSARAAYPDESVHEWWLPTPIQRKKALELGKSELMIRLLMGDNIGLSINQAFDSPVWLEVVRYIDKLKRPSISLSLIANDPTPNTFVEQTAVRFFNPKLTKQDFLLSAWPNLDDKARELISKNLLSTYDFENMLKGVGLLPDYMIEQSVWLHRFHNYLNEYREKNILHPAQMSSKPLWKRVSDKSIKDNMGKEIFSQIRSNLRKIFKGDRESRNKLISNRSALYKCLEDNDPEFREKLRMIIDYHYNGMLAESVAEGRASLSSVSLNEAVDLDEMKEQISISDVQYDPAGLVNVFGLVGLEKKSIGIKPLSWENVFDVMASDEFEVSLAKMNSVPNDHPEKEAFTEQHVDFLSDALGERLVGGSQFLNSADNAVGIVVSGVGAGLILYTLFFNVDLSQISQIQQRMIEKIVDVGVGVETGLLGKILADNKPLLYAAERNLVGKIRKNLLKKSKH